MSTQLNATTRTDKVPIWIEFKGFFIGLAAFILVGSGIAGTIIYMNVTRPPSEVELATTTYDETDPPSHIAQFSGIDELEEDSSVPRTNGPHTAETYRWGTFSEDEINHNQVIHNLEHGGTVVYFDPSLTAEQKDQLEKLSNFGAFVMAPRSNLETEIVVLSWGRSIVQDALDVDEIRDFHDEWKNKSPEKLAY